MKAVLSFFTRKWVIQAIGLLLLSALLWFVGPLIAVAGNAPLEGDITRIVTIVVLWILWIIWRLIAELRAAKKDQQFVAELAKPEPKKSAEAQAADENVELLGENFQKALAVLKETRGKGSRDRQFLYELPWYVIIGPPGSGKTTALLNSGLRFPLAERMGNQPIRGVSGTRNCEWMFTDEAILIDTAGRYTTQDSYQAVDASEWTGFLGLLKQHRPRRPINGVLVTLSLSDLLQQTEEERSQHAKAVRQRIQELYTQLGVRFPIYMLLTKTDLVAGFNEFFADLTQEDRAQVWGETFSAAASEDTNAAIESFGRCFDELLQRLSGRMLRRVQDEHDISRRSLVLDFPQQLALLKPALLRFLDEAFSINRYESKPLLRGVYLTSGTQEGTPIDRVMGMLANTYKINRQAAPVYSGRGRSFFLTRLLKEVIFPEAELAGVDPKVEQRQRLLQVGAYSAVGVLSLLLLGLWILSYQRNVAAIGQIQTLVNAFKDAKLDTTTTQSHLRTLLPKLDTLLASRNVYEDYGITSRFGLYQGNKLSQAAENSYEYWLKNYFQPLLMRRTAERMSGPEAANNDVLYELLRLYLMLAQPERMDVKLATPWIRGDWERTFASEPDLLAKLSLHLDNLLALKLDPVPIDEPFIASVRAKLSQVPQINQLYARFKSEGLLDNSHDFHAAEALAPSGSRVFQSADGRDIGSLNIPGLFTGWGYSEVFLKKGEDYVKDAVTDNWVLGNRGSLNSAEMDRLNRDFQKLYLADYQKYWMDLLNAVKLRRPGDINQTIELLELLARPDSPLKALLVAVEKNTSLTKVAASAAEKLMQAAGLGAPAAGGATGAAAKPPVLDPRTQKLLSLANQASGGAAPKDDPVAALEAAFKSVNDLVRGSGAGPLPLDATLQTLAKLRESLLPLGGGAAGKISLEKALAQVAAGGGGALGTAKADLAQLPAPVKAALLPLVEKGSGQVISGAKGELNAKIKTDIGIPCAAAFAGRYPFTAGSGKEATLMDFGKFFAPSGVMEQFFQANLKAFLDTNRPVWSEIKVDNQGLGLSPGTIRQFQTAAKIRLAFFSTGTPTPGVSFDLKPLALDNAVATFRLNIEGQELVYQHGPEQVTPLKWPGTSPGSGARIVFETVDGKQVGSSAEGAWALFKLLDQAVVTATGDPTLYQVTFQSGGMSARFELRAGSVNNPFKLPEIKTFSCPEGI